MLQEQCSVEDRARAVAWCRENLEADETAEASAYGLKHVFERAPGGFYSTEDDFADLLFDAGFECKTESICGDVVHDYGAFLVRRKRREENPRPPHPEYEELARRMDEELARLEANDPPAPPSRREVAFLENGRARRGTCADLAQALAEGARVLLGDDHPDGFMFRPATPLDEGRLEMLRGFRGAYFRPDTSDPGVVVVLADRPMRDDHEYEEVARVARMVVGDVDPLWSVCPYEWPAPGEGASVEEFFGPEIEVDSLMATNAWIRREAEKNPKPVIAMPPPPLGGANAGARGAWVTAEQRALRVGGQGTRLATGFPTVDLATRGGLLLGKTVAIGGAPGAGKTATAVQLAARWLGEGAHVGLVAADEDADALLIRLGQLAGISRDALESGDPDAREALASWCRTNRLLLVDGDDDSATIERVSAKLREQAKGAPSVLIVDSIQTARADASAGIADPRPRVNAVVRAIKSCAKAHGHLVVATSEISKAAYRNREQAENVNPLSAFKDSGDIEYGVSLALVLVNRPGMNEVVDAAVVKNRLGPGRPSFALRLDHARAAVREAGVGEVATLDPLATAKLRVVSVVTELAGACISKSALAERVGGRKATTLKAINALLDDRRLFESSKGIRVLLPGDPGTGDDR